MWLHRHRHHFVAALSGAAISISLAPLHWWPLAFIGPGLIFWCLQRCAHDSAFAVGWWSGLGLFGTGASWVYVSIHFHSDTPAFLAALMTFAFCSGMALFSGIFAWLYVKWMRHLPLHTAGFVSLWVLIDALRGSVLTGFPWLYIGLAHTDSPLSHLAPAIRASGLTAMTLLVSVLLINGAEGISRQTHRKKGWLYTLLAITILVAANTFPVKTTIVKIGDRPLTVGIAQGNIDQDDKWRPENIRSTLSNYANLTEALWGSDIIVWPESAITIDYLRASSYLNAMHDIALENKSTLITGIPYISPEGDLIHNSITAVGLGSGLYHKQKLVPFGEYVPLQDLLRGTLAFFDLPMSSFNRGNADQSLLSAGTYSLAPFICYEIAYPEFVRQQLKQANLIVTVSNDAWFGGSWAPWQHQQIARMRALETGRYVIRATNNGISSVIDPQGHVIASTPQFERATLVASVWPVTGSTPYLTYGSLPLWFFCLTILAILAWQGRQFHQREH